MGNGWPGDSWLYVWYGAQEKVWDKGVVLSEEVVIETEKVGKI